MRRARKVVQQGFSLQRIEGANINAEQLEHFYQCYQITYLRRGRQAYLNRAFFQQLLQQMPEQILLVIAKQETSQTLVAAALFFYNQTSLYGRYWGSKVEADSLHFEACYYQGIEFCLEKNLTHFDPGTQGEHKISRGFHPTLTWSNHWLAEAVFDEAINNFVEEEAKQVKQYAEDSCNLLPFRQKKT